MKITYRILWFDDSPELLDSLGDEIDYLKTKISDLGFVPEVLPVHTPKEFFAYQPFDSVDLVIVDFDLEEFGEGQDFIAQVRSHKVFTNVIFYSAQGADILWDGIRKRQLEGVFVANKNNIIARILAVCEHSMRKVLDVENMRGIVMAEVGELDRLLGAIVERGIPHLTMDQQKDIYSRFHKASHQQIDELRGALDSFLADPKLEQLLELCDSDKRWSNFNRLKRHHTALKAIVLGDYQSDVLKPRNFLAHGVPSRTEAGVLKFSHRGKHYEFTPDEGKALRARIIGYKRLFQKLLDNLETHVV